MKSVFRVLAATAALGAVLGMAAPSSAQTAKTPDMRKDLRAKFEASLKKINDDFEGAFAAEFIDLTDGQRVMMEQLLCFKRAGCDGILSYFAIEVARLLGKS